MRLEEDAELQMETTTLVDAFILCLWDLKQGMQPYCATILTCGDYEIKTDVVLSC